MVRAMLLIALVACHSGTIRSDRGLLAQIPEQGRCESAQINAPRDVGGELKLLGGERTSWIACVANDGQVQWGVAVIDGLRTDVPLDVRLMGIFTDEGVAKPSAPPTEQPSRLSGAEATEHRLAFDFLGPEFRVLRYVLRGDTLYYAYVMGRESTMREREAEHAAWLDAVRIDDLSR